MLKRALNIDTTGRVFLARLRLQPTSNKLSIIAYNYDEPHDYARLFYSIMFDVLQVDYLATSVALEAVLSHLNIAKYVCNKDITAYIKRQRTTGMQDC